MLTVSCYLRAVLRARDVRFFGVALADAFGLREIKVFLSATK